MRVSPSSSGFTAAVAGFPDPGALHAPAAANYGLPSHATALASLNILFTNTLGRRETVRLRYPVLRTSVPCQLTVPFTRSKGMPTHHSAGMTPMIYSQYQLAQKIHLCILPVATGTPGTSSTCRLDWHNKLPNDKVRIEFVSFSSLSVRHFFPFSFLFQLPVVPRRSLSRGIPMGSLQ